MREEILLEVVDEAYGLIEEVGSFAAVHEDSLCSKHFWHFCEHCCAALTYDEIGENAEERVGCDTRETIGSTALETNAKFRERNVLTCVISGDGIKFASYFCTFDYLIANNLLCHHEANAIVVIVAKHLLKLVWLIVFASKAHYEHSTSVRMKDEVA